MYKAKEKCGQKGEVGVKNHENAMDVLNRSSLSFIFFIFLRFPLPYADSHA